MLKIGRTNLRLLNENVQNLKEQQRKAHGKFYMSIESGIKVIDKVKETICRRWRLYSKLVVEEKLSKQRGSCGKSPPASWPTSVEMLLENVAAESAKFLLIPQQL